MTETEEQRKGELEFPRARAQVEAELEAYLGGGGLTEVPALVFEKGETRFAFPVPSIGKEQAFDAWAFLPARPCFQAAVVVFWCCFRGVCF